MSSWGADRTEEWEQELRWAMAEAVVMWWHTPDQPHAAFEPFREMFQALESVFTRILEIESASTALEARTLAYCIQCVWLGGLLGVTKSPGPEPDSTMQPISLALVDYAVTGPALDVASMLAPPVEFVAISHPPNVSIDGTSPREQILAAAIEVLVDLGPTDFSLKEVARRAGKQEPAISRYYGGRAALLAEAGVKIMEAQSAERLATLSRLATGVGTEEQLLQFGVEVVASASDGEAAELRRSVFSALVAARQDPEAMGAIGAAFDLFLNEVEAIFSLFADRGLIAQRFEYASAAEFMARLIVGRAFFDADPLMSISDDQFRLLVAMIFVQVLAAAG